MDRSPSFYVPLSSSVRWGMDSVAPAPSPSSRAALPCVWCVRDKDALHTGDLSKGPGPLDQLAFSWWQSLWEAEDRLPWPPSLGRQPYFLPQQCLPKQECPGRLQLEGRKEEGEADCTDGAQGEESWSRRAPLTWAPPGAGASSPPARRDEPVEAHPSLLPLNWHFFLWVLNSALPPFFSHSWLPVK